MDATRPCWSIWIGGVEIASVMGVCRSTLIEYFGPELSIARTRLGAAVAAALVRNVIGGNVADQIFYLKTRMGWSERVTVARESRIENVGVVGPLNIEELRRGLSSAGREALDTLLAQAPDLPRRASHADGQLASLMKKPQSEANCSQSRQTCSNSSSSWSSMRSHGVSSGSRAS